MKFLLFKYYFRNYDNSSENLAKEIKYNKFNIPYNINKQGKDVYFLPKLKDKGLVMNFIEKTNF